jgi:hypothetical protein
MVILDAGDIVRITGTDYEMLIIGCAYDNTEENCDLDSWFCVWEVEHRLFEQVFSGKDLVLVRKERRRIPRGGRIHFPIRQADQAPGQGE